MSLGIESMSPADIAAVTGNSGNNNGGNDGWGGNNGWWIIILLLALGRGWGGQGGYGNGGGQGGGSTQPIIIDSGRFGGSYGCGCEPCATASDVRAAVDQQTLISKLDQQTYGLADSTYALNNAINGGFAGVQQTLCQGFNGINTTVMQGFHGVDNAVCNLGYHIQGGFNGIQHSIDKCCCDTQRAIDGVNYNIASQFCALGNTIQNTTRDVIDNANANSRAILDFLVKDKIDTLQTENLSLRFRASQSEQNAFITANQQAQTAELIRRLGADCPTPAYVVQPPQPVTFATNCCGQTSFAGNGGCNNGCGGF